MPPGAGSVPSARKIFCCSGSARVALRTCKVRPSLRLKVAVRVGLDALFVAGLFDETTGQRRVLPVCDHPADRVAAEDVEHDIEVEVRPLGRPQQLGDVPAEPVNDFETVTIAIY